MEDKVPVKLDLEEQLKHLYLPSAKEVTVVDVPEMKFIAVDGRIEPDATPGTSPGFAEPIGAPSIDSPTLSSSCPDYNRASHRLPHHGLQGAVDDAIRGSRLHRIPGHLMNADDHAARPHRSRTVHGSPGGVEEEAPNKPTARRGTTPGRVPRRCGGTRRACWRWHQRSRWLDGA